MESCLPAPSSPPGRARSGDRTPFARGERTWEYQRGRARSLPGPWAGRGRGRVSTRPSGSRRTLIVSVRAVRVEPPRANGVPPRGPPTTPLPRPALRPESLARRSLTRCSLRGRNVRRESTATEVDEGATRDPATSLEGDVAEDGAGWTQLASCASGQVGAVRATRRAESRTGEATACPLERGSWVPRATEHVHVLGALVGNPSAQSQRTPDDGVVGCQLHVFDCQVLAQPADVLVRRALHPAQVLRVHAQLDASASAHVGGERFHLPSEPPPLDETAEIRMPRTRDDLSEPVRSRLVSDARDRRAERAHDVHHVRDDRHGGLEIER